ncbi:MAG: hypothetical protein LBE65_04285 [Synergistaceae bacterium]|jgi:hypothetical protein|nr:hypothetical protein [Synergistaceae bacterium]
MNTRILSKEEREALSPDATESIYKYLSSDCCPSDILEKTLLHAVIISKLNQCLVDANTLSFLIEKISEYEGTPLFDPDREGDGAANRYC